MSRDGKQMHFGLEGMLVYVQGHQGSTTVVLPPKMWRTIGDPKRRNSVSRPQLASDHLTPTSETYAIKDIAAGEEMLNEYVDTTKMTRRERQEYLLHNYNFECKCRVCSLPERESRESDIRLSAINELNGQLGRTKNGLERTRLLNRLLQLTEEEGVPSRRVPSFVSDIRD
jgi:hypothetical protein